MWAPEALLPRHLTTPPRVMAEATQMRAEVATSWGMKTPTVALQCNVCSHLLPRIFQQHPWVCVCVGAGASVRWCRICTFLSLLWCTVLVHVEQVSTCHCSPGGWLEFEFGTAPMMWVFVIGTGVTGSLWAFLTPPGKCRCLTYLQRGSTARWMKIQLRAHLDEIFLTTHLILNWK